MKALLINPPYPHGLFSMKTLLRCLSKKSLQVPLGLITLAGLLPREWSLRLIDCNVEPLTPSDLKGVDLVFISGLYGQKRAIQTIAEQCRQAGVRTVAGGPIVSMAPEDYPDVDHLILFEAEVNLPPFLADLQAGTPRRRYDSQERPALSTSPIPRWDLVKLHEYNVVGLQYSRGCPFKCEFCTTRFLSGPRFRTKDKEQFLAELEAIYQLGWRGNVAIVDDNFIGDRRRLKSELLPAMVEWMEQRKYPFSFRTNVSIDVVDDEELLALLAAAGFQGLYIGIESASPESLEECAKKQNLRRDLQADLQRLYRAGFEVWAGFIVGFDHDTEATFGRQIDFIQSSGVLYATVAMLAVDQGTALAKRMEEENRMLPVDRDDPNIGFTQPAYVPKMGLSELVQGHRKMVAAVYSADGTAARLRTFLQHFRPLSLRSTKPSPADWMVFFRCLWRFGIRDRDRGLFWQILRESKTPAARYAALSTWMTNASARECFPEVFPGR